MTYHLSPVDDSQPHSLDGDECECNPGQRVIDGNRIIIHNAFDGRELLEEANNILSNNEFKSDY